MSEQCGLRVVRERELLRRTFKTKRAQWKRQRIVNVREYLTRLGKVFREVLSHSRLLRSLPREKQNDVHALKTDYHRRPGKAGAECNEHYGTAFFDAPCLYCFVDCDRYRGRRSVAEAVDVNVDLVHRDVGMFRSRFDDSDIRLMWNQKIDVVTGKACGIESAIGSLRHRSHRVLEYLAARHLHEMSAIIEHFLRELNRRAACWTIQQFRELPVASQERGK